MENDSISGVLKNNPWFERLREEHLRMLVSISSPVQWPAGTTIFREGDRHPNLYLITEGRVAIDISIPSRGRVTILTLGENEVFGWSAVVPVVSIKTATARTVRDTQAVSFDAQALQELCETDHELGCLVYRRLVNIIAGRLSATRLQLIDMYAAAGKGGGA